MTVEEIKRKISEIHKQISEFRDLRELSDNQAVRDTLETNIQNSQQKVEELKLDLKKFLKEESEKRIEVKANELKSILSNFFDNQEWNDNQEKNIFFDKIIDFIKEQKVEITTSDTDISKNIYTNPTNTKPLKQSFNSDQFSYGSAEKIERNIKEPQKKSQQTILQVTFLRTGKVIREHEAAETLIKTLYELGLEDCIKAVKALNLVVNKNLLIARHSPINNGSSKYKYYYRERYGFFFMTHSGTEAKKKHLEQIAEYLGIPIDVKKVPK